MSNRFLEVASWVLVAGCLVTVAGLSRDAPPASPEHRFVGVAPAPSADAPITDLTY